MRHGDQVSSDLSQDSLRFKAALELLHPIPSEDWEVFESHITYKELRKGDLLIEKGKVEKAAYFILSGYVRVFAEVDGKEHCTNFRFENELTCSITSFITQSPSLYSIEAIIDTQFLCISYDAIQEMYASLHSINTVGRKIIEHLFVQKHLREMALLSQSAEERYRSLLNRHPEFVENISIKHLASYLGIQPESLSRIRKHLI